MNKLFLMIVFTLISLQLFAAEAIVKVVEEPVNYVVVILGCLFAISELLASLNVFKGNSVFQIVKNIIAAIYNAMKAK